MSGRPGDRLARIGGDCLELATAIGIAREAIQRGGSADIETLAERLSALLAVLVAAPKDEQHRHMGRLLGLCEEVEALGCTIDAERRRCSDQIAKGGASARAAAAYTNRSAY